MLVLTTGCATRPPAQSLDPELLEQRWISRHAQLSELHSWRMNGRVAVKSDADSWSASLRWQQQAEEFDISFSSLLGQRVAQLKGDRDFASLYLPDERVLSAANISDLLGMELGWQVPMEGLRYWLVGLPVPGDVMSKGLDASGRLQWLEQLDWRIEYSRYRSAGILELPKKMVLTHGDLRVRLVIDRWQIGSAELAH